MTEREKMLSGLLYDPSDPELSRQRDVARNMAAAFNRTTEEEKLKRQEILKALLGSMGEWTELYPSVQFDYGCNTYLGSRCYVNFNATFLDCAEIRLGDDVFVGPNVSFLTPSIPCWPGNGSCGLHQRDVPIPKEACKPISVGRPGLDRWKRRHSPRCNHWIRYRHWRGQRGDERHPCRSARRGKSLPGSAGKSQRG